MASRHNESFYCTFNLEKVFAKIREMLFLLQSSLMRSGLCSQNIIDIYFINSLNSFQECFFFSKWKGRMLCVFAFTRLEEKVQSKENQFNWIFSNESSKILLISSNIPPRCCFQLIIYLIRGLFSVGFKIKFWVWRGYKYIYFKWRVGSCR